MQCALTTSDNGTAQAVFCSCRPQSNPARPPPIMTVSKRIFLLLLQTTQSLINPAGKFAFAQCISRAMGCTPFQRSLRKVDSCSIDCADVVTLKRCSSPAARQAQSSPRQVPIPTRVRRRKSSRLLTFKFSTAYCTSPAVTASHSHTKVTVQTAFAQPQACDRHDDKPQNRAAGRQGDDFTQGNFSGFL